VLKCRKLTYCIVFVAATCLLVCLGIRPAFARGNLHKAKPRFRAVIEDSHKYSDKIVRDSQANDTPCVPHRILPTPVLVSIGTLQPLSPAPLRCLLSQHASAPRAPPHTV